MCRRGWDSTQGAPTTKGKGSRGTGLSCRLTVSLSGERHYVIIHSESSREFHRVSFLFFSKTVAVPTHWGHVS